MNNEKIKALKSELIKEKERIESNKSYGNALDKKSYGSHLEQSEAIHLVKCESRLSSINDMLTLLEILES